MKKNILFASFFFSYIISGTTLAIEPEDVTYDGVTLNIPYVKVGNLAYELRLVPTSDSILSVSDCPILCVKLLDFSESQLADARNPTLFDGQKLILPRISFGDEIFTGSFRHLSQYAKDIYFSISDAAIAPLFSIQDRQNWNADELEARLSFCQENSYRWDTLFPFGDFNNDGYEDIFVPISCYQGATPDNGGENNLAVKTGWFLLCSDEVGRYRNCSKNVFGEEFIDTSKDGSKGGLPYHHNTEEPKDLNGDGFIDFALTLNRDDGVGRKAFDANTPEGLQAVVDQCFNGDEGKAASYPSQGLTNCTFFSDQHVFLSNGDGTYTNARIPWTPTWTHSLRSLPNDQGGFDLISIGYDVVKVARIIGSTVVDITDEYKLLENFDKATKINPYVGGYFEFDGVGYWISNGVLPEFVTNLAQYADFDIETGWSGAVEGITVWKWDPSTGFQFSDYYMPPPENFFKYKTEGGNLTLGLYKRGIPQLGGGGSNYYNFIKQAVLDPSEGEILIVQGENSGFLINPKRELSPDFQVVESQPSDPYIEDSLYPVMVVEGFYIQDGKISVREKSVIEGDILFNSPGMYFRDINNDNYDDLVTITGQKVNGGAYLNDKTGTLKRLDTLSILPELPEGPIINNTSFLFWPLRGNGTLDVLYMDRGAVNPPGYWPEQDIFNAGNLGIIRGNYLVDTLPTHTVKDQLNMFYECAKTALTDMSIGYIWNCLY